MSSSAPTARPGLVVAVLAAGSIVATLMQTLVVPLIGELPRLLHTSAGNASWVVTATLLAGSAAIAAIGRLVEASRSPARPGPARPTVTAGNLTSKIHQRARAAIKATGRC